MSRLDDPQRHHDLLNYQLKRLLNMSGAPAVRLCEGRYGVTRFQRYGVTRFQWRLVAALVEGGPMAPTVLARQSGVELAKVSRALKEMVLKGFIQRTGLPGDGRRALVTATQEGHRLYAELFPQLAAINRRVMEALDSAESAALEAMIEKLTARAREIHESGGGVAERTDRRLGGSRRFWSALRPPA
jgi:DNA-binding MarR family transcriptional regulator